MNLVLKIVQTFDFSVPCSTTVYQLMIVCSSVITLDIFRQKTQVATRYEITPVAERDRIQFNITSISLY